MLVKTRQRPSATHKTVAFLRSLGIECEENGFWDKHRLFLSAIYSKMQTAARARMHELHSDHKGGSDAEFRAFYASYRAAKRRFKWNGMREEEQTCQAIPANARIRSKAKAFRVIELTKRGCGAEYIRRELRCSRGFIRKVQRACFTELPPCGCGRALLHNGTCAFRFARPATWNSWKRGKPLSETARQRIALAKRGVPKSVVTRRRIALASTWRTRDWHGRFLEEAA